MIKINNSLVDILYYGKPNLSSRINCSVQEFYLFIYSLIYLSVNG